MILFNFTGLAKFYWLPKAEFERDRALWFWSFRIFNFEVIACSLVMATEFIGRLDRDNTEFKSN